MLLKFEYATKEHRDIWRAIFSAGFMRPRDALGF
jgi:hypothetical protein